MLVSELLSQTQGIYKFLHLLVAPRIRLRDPMFHSAWNDPSTIRDMKNSWVFLVLLLLLTSQLDRNCVQRADYIPDPLIVSPLIPPQLNGHTTIAESALPQLRSALPLEQTAVAHMRRMRSPAMHYKDSGYGVQLVNATYNASGFVLSRP